MLTTVNEYKLLKVFFDCPEKSFHIRQLSRLTGISAPGILKILKRLKKHDLLVVEKNGVTDNVRASKTDNFLRLKRFYNTERLFETGLVDSLRDVYQEPEVIVLFGSYSRGEDISSSDIDIAIIAPKEREFSAEKFERTLKRKLNTYVIQTKTAKPEFLNSLANGIVLYGFLKVV